MTNNSFFKHSTVLSVLRLQLYFIYQSLKCVCVREKIILCVFLLCTADVRNKNQNTDLCNLRHLMASIILLLFLNVVIRACESRC